MVAEMRQEIIKMCKVYSGLKKRVISEVTESKNAIPKKMPKIFASIDSSNGKVVKRAVVNLRNTIHCLM